MGGKNFITEKKIGYINRVYTIPSLSNTRHIITTTAAAARVRG